MMIQLQQQLQNQWYWWCYKIGKQDIPLFQAPNSIYPVEIKLAKLDNCEDSLVLREQEISLSVPSMTLQVKNSCDVIFVASYRFKK